VQRGETGFISKPSIVGEAVVRLKAVPVDGELNFELESFSRHGWDKFVEDISVVGGDTNGSTDLSNDIAVSKTFDPQSRTINVESSHMSALFNSNEKIVIDKPTLSKASVGSKEKALFKSDGSVSEDAFRNKTYNDAAKRMPLPGTGFGGSKF
jgi:hypothetical protein